MPRQPQADLRERVAEAVLRQQVYLRATLSRAITTSITHIGLSPRDSTLFPPSSIATAKSRVTRRSTALLVRRDPGAGYLPTKSHCS